MEGICFLFRMAFLSGAIGYHPLYVLRKGDVIDVGGWLFQTDTHVLIPFQYEFAWADAAVV